MDFTGDERGQSVQIGAVLLFAVLILSFSSYQAFVVPEQNREVEFSHNQQVQSQMQDLRNAIVSVPSTSSQQAVTLPLGTQYPGRLLATNPGPPSGLLYTNGTADESRNLTVRNAVALDNETADYWDGTSARHYNTGSIAYQPEYNVYGSAPETVYEHSVVYNQFRTGNLTLSDQTIVDGREITLVALNGSVSRASSGSISVDVRPVSRSSRTVQVTNATASSNVSISFLSRLPASAWRNDVLEEEIDAAPDNGTDAQYIANVTQRDGPGSLYNVTIILERGAIYRLKMAKAGVGTHVTSESAAYLTDVGGNGTTITRGESQQIVLEVRDAYNNPKSGVTVEGGADGGSAGSLSRSEATTDGDGRVSFEYRSNGSTPVGTNQLNFSIQGFDASFDGGTPENVSVGVTVKTVADERADRIGLAYNGDAEARDGDDSDPNTGGIEYTLTNTHDQRVTITDWGIASQSANVDRLSDQVADPNNERRRAELYVAGDLADGYTDVNSPGADLPTTFDIDFDGFDPNGNPRISGRSNATVYLYEFRPDGSNDAVDMTGKNVTQTVSYTFPDGETRASAFTVTGNYSESDDIRPPAVDFYTVKHNDNRAADDDVKFEFEVADKSGIDRVILTATDEDGNTYNTVTREPTSGSRVDYALDLGEEASFRFGDSVDVTITIIDDSPNGNTHVCDGSITSTDTDLIDTRGLRCTTA